MIEDDLALGASSLSLEAEAGLCGNDFLKFGGASAEKPAFSEGLQDLDLVFKELPRDNRFLEFVGADFAEVDRPGGADKLGATDGVNGPRFGVADLDVDFKAGKEGLKVGVKDREVDIEEVVFLTFGATFLVEPKVTCKVGVEDPEGFVAEGNVGRPVGVSGLGAVKPPDNEGFSLLSPEEFCPDGKFGCFGGIMLLEAASAGILVSCMPMK